MVMLFHKVTGYPVIKSKLYLEQLSCNQQKKVFKALEVAEEKGKRILHDPLEDEPKLQEIFTLVRLQAIQETQDYHHKRIAELEKSSPAVANFMSKGRGLCHIEWQKMKQILKENYGIDWMSPAEINPGTIYD